MDEKVAGQSGLSHPLNQGNVDHSPTNTNLDLPKKEHGNGQTLRKAYSSLKQALFCVIGKVNKKHNQPQSSPTNRPIVPTTVLSKCRRLLDAPLARLHECDLRAMMLHFFLGRSVGGHIWYNWEETFFLGSWFDGVCLFVCLFFHVVSCAILMNFVGMVFFWFQLFTPKTQGDMFWRCQGEASLPFCLLVH